MSGSKQPAKSWADIEQDNEEDGVDGLERIDENGNKVVTTYFREADGRQMKRERTFRVLRKSRSVAVAVRRRQQEWQKFGYEMLDFSKGNNKKFMTTSSLQDETLQPPKNFGLLAAETTDDYGALIGAAHASAGVELNANKRLLSEIQRYFDMIADPDPRPLLALAEKEEAPTPPTTGPGHDRPLRRDNEDSTVRVTNLSEYTDETELEMLFNRCGDVTRLFLARNKETNVSKGFAFITYKTRAEAERAIQMLHKHGFGNVLLNVEWTRNDQPRRK